MEKIKKRSYRNFSDNDFQRVYDFLGSVRTSLLLDGINIDYDISNSLKPQRGIGEINLPGYTFTPIIDREKIRIGIINKELRSNFPSLFFPWSNEIGDVVFTKTHNKYRVKQEFHLGSILNNRDYLSNKEFFEKVLLGGDKIDDGEEWKLKKFQQDVLLYSVADAMDLSRKLIQRLTKEKFEELRTDLHTSAEDVVGRDSSVNYPLLNHKFGFRDITDMYMGTRIMLGEEVVKHLRDNNLLENLFKYHEFLNELN